LGIFGRTQATKTPKKQRQKNINPKKNIKALINMAGLGDIVQKAVYLGVGLASFAGEKASSKLAELRTETQKLADELVKRGEMSTEEARRFVEDMMNQAQGQINNTASPSSQDKPSQPRRIEILEVLSDESSDESSSGKDPEVDNLRQEVQKLQEELQNLQRDES
jgi:polyhydroxyalkanoate synthesis regulator phasin